MSKGTIPYLKPLASRGTFWQQRLLVCPSSGKVGPLLFASISYVNFFNLLLPWLQKVFLGICNWIIYWLWFTMIQSKTNHLENNSKTKSSLPSTYQGTVPHFPPQSFSGNKEKAGLWSVGMSFQYHRFVESIWVFPKIMVPPNHPLKKGFPSFSPSILVVFPLFLETPIWEATGWANHAEPQMINFLSRWCLSHPSQKEWFDHGNFEVEKTRNEWSYQHKKSPKNTPEKKLVVSTQLKNRSQNGNLPQIGMKINKIFETTTDPLLVWACRV